MTFLLFLHITAAVFLIGPLTIAAAAFPSAIRGGKENLSLLRWLARTTRFYGIGSIVVFVLGLSLVSPGYSFGQFWISSSMTLFVVAAGLMVGLVERDERSAIKEIESGGNAQVQERRILGVTAAVGLCWLAILLMMVFKFGA